MTLLWWIPVVLDLICGKILLGHNLGLRQLKSKTVPYMSNSARFSQIHQLMGSMPNQVTLRVWTNLLEMIVQVEFHGQMVETLILKIHHHQNYRKGNPVPSEKAVKNAGERKRKRPSETPSSEQNTRDEELNKAMAEALLEMVAASKWREVAARHIEERFTITNCIKALDEIQKIDQQLYFAALDLFEDPTVRETFLSLKGDDLRLTWLQGKCGKYNHFEG
ncbi:hypothetical protein OIU77_026097 [Salix suchowensis]|uniref:Uncharacterized protein n=1 Tax=Salix suchowensis TaxID=1278906 RepID=A0ABQ9BZB2_9ROSI|nr:hypothetical protein OIU77_026097 [Salix suchowensis]